jgi:methyl-accepting chemotaxis protein
MKSDIFSPLNDKDEANADDFLLSTHGFWRPGVRFMGKVRFTTKAAIICLIFTIPIVVSTSLLMLDLRGRIQSTHVERMGVVLQKEVVPLISLLQAQRRLFNQWGASEKEPAEFERTRSAIAKQLDSMEVLLQPYASTMSLNDAFKAVKEGNASVPVVPKKAVLHRQVERHNKLLIVALNLMREVQDKSGLTLDPELDTFYLTDAAFTRLPVMAETSAQLRVLLERYVLTSEGNPDMLKGLGVNEALGEYTDRYLQAGIMQLLGDHPGIRTDSDVEAPITAMKRLYEVMQAVGEQRPLTMPDVTKLADIADTGFAKAQAHFVKVLDQSLENRLERLAQRRNLVLAIIALSLGLSAYLFYCFYLVMRGGLTLIGNHLTEMAEGDLRRAPVRPWGKDEPAELVVHLRTAYVSLHQLIRRVRHSARELQGSGKFIAEGSIELSNRTASAASALEQQAQAMEKIGSAASASAERANMAAQFASDNANVAERGGKAFGEVEVTMRGIKEASAKIADIIGVIDSIAFQTNILALNAAVEAARAGESGRGFAVVASEVRMLAKRSAGAAQEIKGLIGQSVDRVEAGSKVVAEAGVTMSDVVSNARQINAFLSEISRNALEQAHAVEQVGMSIHELDRNTQENAAMVQDSNLAAQELRKQAELLQEEIANFRVA